MKRLIVAVLLLTAAITCRAAEVGSLRCEYLADPLGIDAMRPRLSWVVSSSLRGDRQTAYRVLVASSPELLARGEGDLWDSGETASGRSIQVEYGGKPLAGLAKCYWKVRVWDADDRPSRWSEPARWSMGPLCEEDWGGAEWIAARDGGRGGTSGPSISAATSRTGSRTPGLGSSARAGRSGTCTRTPRPATILRL